MSRSNSEVGGQKPIFCAIVPLHNDDFAVHNVIRQLYRANIQRAIFVANGCTESFIEGLRTFAAPGFHDFMILRFPEVLGLDVPRAIGAMAAIRKYANSIRIDYLVFVDGDLRGGFGPTLKEICDTAVKSDSDVQFLASHKSIRKHPSFTDRPDVAIWNEVVRYLGIHDLINIAPSQMPMVVRSRVFDHVSPYWLHQPGLWLARLLLIRPSAALSVYPHDVAHEMGNPSRSRDHSEKLQTTLLGDAVEGARVALGRKQSRAWHGRILDGYHTDRRVDVILAFMSSMKLEQGTQFFV